MFKLVEERKQPFYECLAIITAAVTVFLYRGTPHHRDEIANLPILI
jgi:hypothetical protein